MKKVKLTLEKFRVAKLNNLSNIKGGVQFQLLNDQTVTTTDKEDGPKCDKFSEIAIQ
ncbi:hypothetical protein [Tenacibaculum sp.]|uniref:hypothetical protein n=1 Tax=Tenacibaculum sp. TaxID=1906242 RepID=UPI003D0E7338